MRDFLDRIYGILARHPWWTLGLLLAAHTAWTMDCRALWFSDEVRYANAFENVIHAGKWLVLSLNGQPYPDKPPLYFWFLALLHTISRMPAVFFLGAALSGLAYLFATLGLSKSLGRSRDSGFTAGLVLLTTFVFIGLLHYSRMDLLFAAMILGSQAFFYKAWGPGGRGGRGPVLAGFLLAGLATLTKGPLGLIFPLLTSFCFLAWRGELRRMGGRATLQGLGLMLGLLLAWLLAALAVEGTGFIQDILGKQIVARATNTFHHKEGPWYYFLALPPAWLPWTLLPLVLPFWRVFTPKFWKTAWNGRRQAGARAWLWCMILPAFILLSCLSGKVFVYILPFFAPLALLTADVLEDLDWPRAGLFWVLASGFLLLLALALPVAEALLPLPVTPRGVALSTVLLAAAAIGLFLLRRDGARAPLLFLTLALLVWSLPLNRITLPSLDDYMSPKRQGSLIRAYVAEGYKPLAYDIYSGVFTYYAGTNLLETNDLSKIAAEVEENPKCVLVLRKKHWDAWENRPSRLVAFDEQNIAGQVYVLAATAPR